jgi:hypothetical protein
MALAAPVSSSRAGTAITPATPLATENITTDRALHLYVACSSGAGTVTPQDPGSTPAGSVATNAAISVGAGVTKMIYLPASLINSSGQIQVVFAVGTFLGTVFYA